MDYAPLALTVQSTYADLVTRAREDSVLDIEGTPIKRKRGKRYYWYMAQRLGNETRETYLGPDTHEIRDRVERAREVNEDRKIRQIGRRSLVRMCQEGGMQAVDRGTGKVLLALYKAGFFRLRGVLVGTHAFRCYPNVLGVAMPEALAVTEDIDVATFHSIAVAIDDALNPALEDTLRKIGSFTARPTRYRQPTSWRDQDSQTVVELLTPNQGAEREEPMELPSVGAFATPLRHLDFLIHRPIQAVALYRSGVLVNVPTPARYAVHKLIIATRRLEVEKARKDILQSAALIRVLAEDRPDELEEVFIEARNRGPRWREQIDKGLRRLPRDAFQALERVTSQGK